MISIISTLSYLAFALCANDSCVTIICASSGTLSTGAAATSIPKSKSLILALNLAAPIALDPIPASHANIIFLISDLAISLVSAVAATSAEPPLANLLYKPSIFSSFKKFLISIISTLSYLAFALSANDSCVTIICASSGTLSTGAAATSIPKTKSLILALNLAAPIALDPIPASHANIIFLISATATSLVSATTSTF